MIYCFFAFLFLSSKEFFLCSTAMQTSSEQLIRINGVNISLDRIRNKTLSTQADLGFTDVISGISSGVLSDFGIKAFTIDSDGMYLLSLRTNTLKSLSFQSCELDFSAQILDANKLTLLRIENCTSSDGDFFSHFREESEMVEIGFSGAKLSENDLAWILKNEKLERLYLEDATVSPGMISRIAEHLTMIKEIKLKNIKGHGEKDINSIAKLAKLEMLDLGQVALQEDIWKELSRLKSLRKLNLSGTKISDNGMAWIGRLPNLETLSLNNTEVSDAGIVELGNCSKLKTLEWINSNVTVEGVKQLEILKKENETSKKETGTGTVSKLTNEKP